MKALYLWSATIKPMKMFSRHPSPMFFSILSILFLVSPLAYAGNPLDKNCTDGATAAKVSVLVTDFWAFSFAVHICSVCVWQCSSRFCVCPSISYRNYHVQSGRRKRSRQTREMLCIGKVETSSLWNFCTGRQHTFASTERYGCGNVSQTVWILLWDTWIQVWQCQMWVDDSLCSIMDVEFYRK